MVLRQRSRSLHKGHAMIAMIALLAASAGAEITEGPLAPADAGKVQCHSPDIARKVCRSLAYYSLDGRGNYINTATVLLSASSTVAMEVSTPVVVVDGAVCGVLRAEDLLRGRVVVDGKPMSDERSAPILEQVAASMSRLFGHQICTRYEAVGDHLIAKGSIDGTHRPDLDQTVIWVSPSAGFTVAP